MRALVTGSEGFVGPYLVKELLGKGHSVIATYKEKPGNIYNARYVQMDILDEKQVMSVFEKEDPHMVFHLAGISDVKFSIDNPEITLKVNVEGTKNIITAAEEMERSPSVLLIGSAEEYGVPQYVPVDEEHPLDPLTPYATSKVLAEKLGRESAKRGFRVIISRSFNHIGPGQTENFVTAAFAKQIAQIEKSGKKELFVGNLESKRDFTDVRDIVRGYVLALEKCETGEAYNLCSGKAYVISEILDKLLALSKVKIEVKQDPKRMRKSDVPEFVGDYRKFFKKTGWKPLIDIETSLADILNYWRKNV
jgi:GDP-4-dehydro-6-deoxy-D-mannose reductase